jgi:DNA-binding MarR family transcriptional regulator
MILERNIDTAPRMAMKKSSSNTPVPRYEVLGDIRRIIQASDVFSRKLHKASGLTTTQALTLRAIAELGETTSSSIAKAASISTATATAVLDRLELNGLIARYRSKTDRRIVHARLTSKGEMIARTMPNLMDEEFLSRFQRLPLSRRGEIASAFREVAQMLNADATDAAAAENGRKRKSAKRQ